MPTKADSGMGHVDWMFYAILGLSIFCFVAITVAVVYLTWRYRARPGHKTEPSTAHDNVLEVTWTIIPSIICVFIFIGGWKGYLNMTTAPGDAMEINVVGQKWVWGFTYTKDLDTLQRGELHVPVNRPTKLIMRSEDVLHSFYVPAFRVKQDVIPGRYSYVWFQPDLPGVYRVYCAEYCGDAHSDMKTKVIVHEPGGYEKWLDAEYEKDQVDCNELPDAERQECFLSQGEKIYTSKGCKQCHSLDGSAGTGPTFQGMWGQSRTFSDGSTGTVDENYVRESLLDPMAKIRSGFNPVMPTFKGKLKDKDIDAIIFWMKSL
jgi:cytochrome c oxidase subunit 2